MDKFYFDPDYKTIYIVLHEIKANRRTVCVSHINTWEKDLYTFNTPQYTKPKWTDIMIDKNQFIREIGEYKFNIEDGKIKSITHPTPPSNKP